MDADVPDNIDDDDHVDTTLVEEAIIRMLQDTNCPDTPPSLTPTYAEVVRVRGNTDLDEWNDGDGEDDEDEDGEDDEMDYSDAFVPCEICNEMVDFHAYAVHIETCMIRESVFRNTLPALRSMNQNAQESIFLLPSGGTGMPTLPQSMLNRPAQVIYDSQNDVVAQIGIRLMQALQTNNEYEYNNAMQELMGGPVRVGVRDINAACPVILDVPQNTACTICLAMLPIVDAESLCTSLPVETRKTPCSHYFCDPCITKWLSEHKTCPNCLQEIESASD